MDLVRHWREHGEQWALATVRDVRGLWITSDPAFVEHYRKCAGSLVDHLAFFDLNSPPQEVLDCWARAVPGIAVCGDASAPSAHRLAYEIGQRVAHMLTIVLYGAECPSSEEAECIIALEDIEIDHVRRFHEIGFHGVMDELSDISWMDAAIEVEAAALRSSGAAADRLSGPLSPKDISKRFKLSWKTLSPRFKSQQIRNERISSKAYRVHLDDLPPLTK